MSTIWPWESHSTPSVFIYSFAYISITTHYIISLWAIFASVSFLRLWVLLDSFLNLFIFAFLSGTKWVINHCWNAEVWKLKWWKLFVTCRGLYGCRLFLLKIKIWELSCNKGNKGFNKRYCSTLYFNPFKFKKVEILKCFMLCKCRQRLALILRNWNSCSLIGLFRDHIHMFTNITSHSTCHLPGSRIFAMKGLDLIPD